MPGRTPVPDNESIAKLAAHGTSMVVFLSSSHLKELKEELKKIAEEGNISKEDKEMMHVFVAGMHVNGFSLAEVLTASQAFSTFLSLWNNEKLRKFILEKAESITN